jgi:hypothetical protein
MKYHVVGQNRDTGARMSLEFEAESKSAAERKATQQGMSVHHVEDVTDGYPGHSAAPNLRSGRRKSRGSRLPLFVIGVALGALIWYYHGWLLAHLHL